MFVNVTASWSGAFTKLGSQALKGITDNIKHYRGSAIDIHKQIGKLPKPKAGWTLPGHRYTGLNNNLENQVKWDPETGEILEIYDLPTGKTDAVAIQMATFMQHDVDYSVCGDNKKCKHEADRKMVKSLDAIPYKERQWGHWLARNIINTKQKNQDVKQFPVQGNMTYLDILPKILSQYKNTKHSSITLTPVEASRKKYESTVYFNLYGDMKQL